MYNKHRNQTIVYQAIVDNKTVISFNTEKKRQSFIEKVIAEGKRRITCQTNINYSGQSAFLKIQ